MHHESLDLFQKLQSYEHEALGTVPYDEATSFALDLKSDDFAHIERKEKKVKSNLIETITAKNAHEHLNLLRGIQIIVTPEGKSAALQLLPLTFKQENFEKYFPMLSELSNNANKEVVCIVQRIRNTFFNRLCANTVSMFCGKFLYSLLLLDKEDISKSNKIIDQDAIMLFVKIWLFKKLKKNLMIVHYIQ